MRNVYKLYFIYLFFSTPFTFFSQCTGLEPVLFLGNDSVYCSTPSLTLTAPAGYTYYNWSDNTHNQTLNVTAAGTYSVEIGIPSGNLVSNGKFELGNVGFTTDYILGTSGAGPWGPLSNPGTYGVSTSPSLLHSNFSSCTDHTPAPGTKMLVVNGAGTPNSLVWSQTIAVTASTDYLFGAWVMNSLNEPNVGILQFFVNGVAIGPTFSSGPTACIWTQFTDSWNSGGSTTAVLKIVNQNSINSGNDFALDDITFSPLCKKTDTIIIGVSAPPTQTTSVTSPTSCTGPPDGSITITSATGTQYSFDGGVTWQTSNVKSGLASGAYTVMTKNAAGCTVTSTVNLISALTAPTQTTTFISPTPCASIPDGSITITSATGVQFSFNGGTNWQTASTSTGLSGGTYTVMSQNASGCTVSSVVTLVSVPSTITQTTSSVAPSLCTGIPDGSITISCATGVQYSFDAGVTWQTSNIKSGLLPGSYTVMSRDAAGCSVSSTVVLTGFSTPPVIAVSNDIVVCQNGVALLSASASGGTSFVYHWNDFSSTASSQVVSPSVSGYYNVKAENQSGCFSAMDSILVTVLPPLSASITAPTVVCPNQLVNLSVFGVSGGLSPYSITWATGSTIIGTGSTIDATVVNSTSYNAQISDGCESTPLIVSTAINITPFVLPPFQIDVNAQCEPASFKLANSLPYTEVQSSLWQISSGESFSNQNSIQLVGYLPGVYDVTLSVLSIDGCMDTISLLNALTVYPKPFADFIFNPTEITSLNPVVNFVNKSTSATSYSWNFENGVPAVSMSENCTSTFPLEQAGNYNVILFAESDHNCKDSILKVVNIIEDQLVYVPNTFTPNGDDKNSTWKFYIVGFDRLRSFELIVFNRWGEIVWKTNDVSAEWDGTYKGSLISDGVYTWTMVAKDVMSDRKSYFKGTLNVIR